MVNFRPSKRTNRMKKIIYFTLASLFFIGCSSKEDEVNEMLANLDKERAERKDAKRSIDHEGVEMRGDGFVSFEKSNCKLKFPEGLEFEGLLEYKKEANRHMYTYVTPEGGVYMLESIKKTPTSTLLRYFNGALVALDMRNRYTGNDSAVKDTVDGVFTMNYKTKGFEDYSKHGYHRLFYKGGYVYILSCVKGGEFIKEEEKDAFFDSFSQLN